MDCPFYLVVCSFRIAPEAERSYTDYMEIHSDYINPSDKDAIISEFCEKRKDCEPCYIDSLLVISNDTCGGPKVIEHWA